MEGFRSKKKSRPQRAVDRVTNYSALGAWIGSATIGDILNFVNPGYDVQNRIGDEIALDSLAINAEFNLQWLSNITGVIVRFVVVYDLSPNLDGTGVNIIPTWDDVFKGVNFGGVAISSPVTHPNVNNVERFLILVDDRIALNSPAGFYTTTTKTSTTVEAREYDIDLRGLESHYVESSLGGTSIYRGAIYLGVFREFTDVNSFVSVEVDVITHSRVYFDEL